MRLKPILILLIFSQSLSAQKPVILSDFIQETHINDQKLYYYLDPTCVADPAHMFLGVMDMDFQELDFSRPDSALLNVRSGTCIWFRIYFENKSTRQYSFHLQPISYSSFGEYELYQQSRKGVITLRRSGDHLNPARKDVNIGGSNDMRIYLPPDESDTLYLKVTLTDDSVISDLTFNISTHESILKKDHSKRLLFGIFFGIMLIMILYHIPLFVKGRENSYLYYILYILSLIHI